MVHDVSFNELTAPTDSMHSEDMEQCIDNLRELIQDGKAQWAKLAAILQVDGDDAGAVFAAARTAMAGMGGAADRSEVQRAREAFPAFNEMYRHLDAACLYEFERFNRHCDELADMTVDRFVEFKREAARRAAGLQDRPRQWSAETPKEAGWNRAFLGRLFASLTR